MEDDDLRCWWWPPADGDGPIDPILVEHHLDWGDPHLDAEGRHRFGFCYDFLTYRFREGDEAAEALHYQDEERVKIRFYRDGDPRSSSFARRVLVFLSMRYEAIDIDEDLMVEVRVWRDEYMRRNAT